MIRLNKDQMVIDKSEYKKLKANADSWEAQQEAPAKAPPKKTTSKHKPTTKNIFTGGK